MKDTTRSPIIEGATGVHDDAAAELRRLNRVLMTRSECDQALVRATTESSLFADLCQIIVEQSGYRMAWVGLVQDDDRRTVRPVAQAGFEDDYLKTLYVSWGDNEHGRGPTGTSIRTRQPVACRDILTDPQFAPWREQALARGYASSIALPLQVEGQVVGALNIYAAEPDAFPASEVRVLLDLTSDLAFGISTLRTRAASRLNEERFESAFSDAAIGMAIVTLDGRFLKVNRAMCDMMGYSDEELQALDFVAITHPADRAMSLECKRRLLHGGERTCQLEKRYLRKDGNVVWAAVAISLVDDSSATPLHFIAQVQDISRLKAAVSALRESEERYRTLVDNTSDFIYSLDREGRHTAVNKSLCQALDLPAEGILGKRHSELGLPSDVLSQWEAVHRRAIAGELVRAEIVRQLSRGEERTYEVELTPVRDGDSRLVAVRGVSRDITEHKRLEAQFRQAQKMEAVGRLAGGIAHDFNNLITVIDSYAKFALAQLRPSDPMHEDVEEISKASQRAVALTRQLLAFGRKSLVQLRTLDINCVVLDMQKMLGRIVGEDIDLVIRTESALWPVKADLGLIEQVLSNLVVNARDAMPNGGTLTIETTNVDLGDDRWAKQPTVAPGPYVLLAVSDTGEGMSQEVQERAFEPFFTTKKDGRGTGLGLATVYGIVKQAGGFIRVCSEPGEGSTFRVYLPREMRADVTPVPPAPPKPVQLSGAGRVVLVVEDEEPVRQVARRILELEGFKVFEATNGHEALLMIRGSQSFDVVLTDVVMPVMSGTQLAHELRKQLPALPVVFMSGYTDHAAAHQDLIDSGTVFLNKPFLPEDLIAKIHLALSLEPATAGS